MTPTETNINLLLNGMLIACSAGAGLFFTRFWRDTKDRLFLAFAAAFFLLCLNWIAVGLMKEGDENRPLMYILRLLAFVVILLGIWDKNRSSTK